MKKNIFGVLKYAIATIIGAIVMYIAIANGVIDVVVPETVYHYYNLVELNYNSTQQAVPAASTTASITP